MLRLPPIDLMFHLTGQDVFATYARGSKCIDYILCYAWVSDASIQGFYEPFQYCLKWDHRAMVVYFDTNLLFGNPTTTCGPTRIFIQRRWF